MKVAVGFTATSGNTESQNARAAQALQHVLAYFPDLEQRSLDFGATRVTVWGRGSLEDCICRLPDGSALICAGSPVGIEGWQGAGFDPARMDRFVLPWDGRAVLLHIDPAGENWTVWNDWVGSVPVYYAITPAARIASTLEPVVVAANQFSTDDFFLPAVISLLFHGHPLGDWTIFRGMHTLPPDSVSTMDARGLHARTVNTIQTSTGDGDQGWNNLIDTMHDLAKQAILQVLQTPSSWILPLSSGLDSRLIAAVAAEAGIQPVRTYTWGSAASPDVINSKAIARKLGLPWKTIELGEDYLRDHTCQWAEMFGSAMLFHGMYQFPFLKFLRSEPAGRIVTGFLGDHLAGYSARFQSEYHLPHRRTYTALPVNWTYFQEEEVRQLFRAPVQDALEQIADEIERQKQAAPGSWQQKLFFVTMWGRQSHFTYFQSTLSDYWSGIATPFLNREYALFCANLPRAALDDRRLQIDMMKRYYSKVMTIPGSYAAEPAIVTSSYLLKRKLSNRLPGKIGLRLFPEIFRARNYRADIAAVQKHRQAALWPIPEARDRLGEWMRLEQVDQMVQNALGGDIRALRKLQTIQPLAYRLMSQPL